MDDNDVFLRAVPSDADEDDVRLYDPTVPDPPPPGGPTVDQLMMMGVT